MGCLGWGFALNLGSVTTLVHVRPFGCCSWSRARLDREVCCLCVKVESQLIFSLIEKGLIPCMQPLFHLVMRFQGLLLAKDYAVVCFGRIFREGNKVADALANFDLSLNIGIHF